MEEFCSAESFCHLKFSFLKHILSFFFLLSVCYNDLFHMKRNHQVRSPTHLLGSLEMAYQTDVKLYTSGHINHNKLFKPSEKIKQGQWYFAKKQTSFMTERNQFPAENKKARKMKRFSGNFCSSILLLPAQAESSSPKNRRPQSPVKGDGAPADFSSLLEILKLKVLKKKVGGN